MIAPREGRVPLSDDWVRYAQSQIDGDLLALLHEQWLQAKGTASVSKADHPASSLHPVAC
jgi:hypothetical protein